MTAVAGFESLPLQRTAVGELVFHHVSEGEGAALVFVHGVLGDWRSWAPQWTAFTPQFRCISYSRRYSVPNGNTGPSPNHSARIEAQDLQQLLQAWGAAPAILVGSSYGAYTALMLALAQPALVRALVLAEPPLVCWAHHVPGGAEVRAAFEREVTWPARLAFEAGDDVRGVQLMTGGIVGGEALARMPPQALARRMENALSMKRLALSSDEFPAPDLARLQAFDKPTLLLAGEHTPPIHDCCFRALCAAMPQAEQQRIPDAGHGVARDNPAVFNHRVLDFLQRRLP